MNAQSSAVAGNLLSTSKGLEIASSAFDLGVPMGAIDTLGAFGPEVAFHIRLSGFPQFQYEERFQLTAGGGPIFPPTPPFDPSNPGQLLAHLTTPQLANKELRPALVVPLQVIPGDPFANDFDPNDPNPPGQPLPAPTPWVQNFTCECDGIGGPMVPSHEIVAKACDKLDDFMCLPFGPSLSTCSKVEIHLKVNRLPISVGIQPVLPNAPLADTQWPAQLVGGAGPLLRSKLFDLRPFASSVPSVASYASSAQADADSTHDIAFSVATSCAPGGAYELMASVAALMGVNTIDDVIRAFAQPHLQAEVGARLVSAVDPILAQRLRFNGPLPAPCTAPTLAQLLAMPTTQPPGVCTPNDVQNLLSASMTYLVWNAFYSAFGPYKNGGVLAVTAISDQTFFGGPPQDQAHAEITFHFDNDEDGDGILTPVDNCPFVANELQFDMDGDGLGDVCDPCPGDPTNDADGDGLCGEVDNCPTVFNPTQSNCNADAEQAQQADVLGDACDPVPCASAQVVWEPFEDDALVEVECPQTCTHQDKLDGLCHHLCPEEKPKNDFTMLCAETDSVRIRVRPYASHSANELLYSMVGESDVPTTVRFCVQNPQLGITCVDPQLDFFEDLMLAESDCWDPNPLAPTQCENAELPEHHYRRITFGSPDQGNGLQPNDPAAEVDYFQPAAAYNASTIQDWDWQVRADFDRWTTGTSPPLVSDSAANNMVGTLWMNADTAVGSTENVGTGLHPAALDNTQLANHYNKGYSDLGIELGWQLDPCTVCIPKPVFPYADNAKTDDGSMGASPAPQPWQPSPHYLVWPTQRRSAKAQPVRMTRGPAANLVLVGFEEFLGLMQEEPTCGPEPAEQRISVPARELLRSPNLRWVSAAEPSVLVGAGENFPFAVALEDTSRGVKLVAGLTTDGAVIETVAEAPACRADFATGVSCHGCSTGACTSRGACCVPSCRADRECPSGTCDQLSRTCRPGLSGDGPAVANATAVLSRTRGGLFLVGGRDVRTGERSQAIWFRSQLGGPWTAMRPAIRYDHVLAATYSTATDELVLLVQHDRMLTGLWAVNVRTQAVRMLRYFGRNREWDRLWLVADLDGSVLLVTARSQWEERDGRPGYAIAKLRLQPSAGLEVEGLAIGHEELLAAPVVDSYGYQLTIKRAVDGEWRVALHALPALELIDASLDELEDYL
jgi:hypothetical protein